MSSQRSSYKSASHQYDVVTPAKGVAYLIDKIDWEHIKSCLAKIKSDAPAFANFAALFAGAFLSALFSLFTSKPCQDGDFDCSLTKSNTVTYLIVSLLLAVLCAFFARRLKSQDKTSVDDITNFMQNVEKKLDK